MTALLALALAAPPTDNFGDPLPAGATARVGTTRMFRPGGWHGAVLTPDGKSLLAPTRDGPIERWDVATGRVVGTVGERREVPADHEYLSLSADGTRLLSLTGVGATVRDAATGRVLTEVVIKVDWTVPTAGATAALSADGTTLAFVAAPPEAGVGRRRGREEGEQGRAGGGEVVKEVPRRTAVVWDVGGAKRRLDVEVDDKHPGVALSADGKVLATWGAVDTPVQFWDATTGKKLGAVTLEGVHPMVAFAPDGRAVLVDKGGAVRLFDPRTGRGVGKLRVLADPSGAMAFSPDGKRLAVGHFHGTVRVWDVAGDKEVSTSDGPVSTRGVAVAFAGGDRLVAWGADWQKAVVWEVPSGKRLSPAGSGVAPGSPAFTPDGKELLTVPAGWVNGPGWVVRRWDPATGRPVGEWKFGDGRAGPSVLNLLPGGTRVGANGGEWAVYDPRTGKPLHALGRGRTGEGSPCAAGELFLSPVGVAPGQVPEGPTKTEVKELATGKVLATIELPVPFPGPYRAARTPDRTRLVTTARLGESAKPETGVAVALWDLATGKKLGEVTLPPGGARSLAAGPDGKTVLTGSSEGLRVLDLAAGKVVREVDTGGLSPVTDPVYRPDGKVFAVGLQDYHGEGVVDRAVVAVYDTATGKQLKTLRGHAGAVTAVAFSPDGKTLASGSWDTTVLVWDVSGVGK
ncbi:MAG: hypothetical protein C0501_24900 [Isosphaera sp.]|nr:hypothetical protein [Isosphaera sp.]